MIISFFAAFIIYIVLVGFSYPLKKLIFIKKYKNIYIKNIDVVYGIFFLTFISILFNFLLPLQKIFPLIIIFGLISFSYLILQKKLKINIIIFSLILLFFIFINFENGHNVDSPVYHTQTIRWSYSNKIVFGLSNLDWLYSLNSSWHIFLSLLKFKFKDVDTIYLISFIPLSIIYYQIYLSIFKKRNLSEISIFLSGSYILFFSIIHPFKNGVIFNHLGNPEVDTVAMMFYIVSFYSFLKFYEQENNYNYFFILITSSLLCVLTKITYIGILILPIYLIINNLGLIKKELLNFFLISFLGFLWMCRNYILSSCLIYPVKFTCLKSNWYFGDERIDLLVNATKGFSRDTRARDRYLDFDHTIYSFDWFKPWFNDYFLNTSLLKISTFIIVLSFLVICIQVFLKKYNKLYFNKKFILLIILSFFINIYFWMQAPEIRFGWGFLIFYPCMFLGYAILNIKNIKFILSRTALLISFSLLFALSINKNYKNLTFDNLFNQYKHQHNYKNIKSIGTFNGYEIFVSEDWKCSDFEKICVNSPKKNYNITEKFGYTFFNN